MTNKIANWINKSFTSFISSSDRVDSAVSFITGDVVAMVVSFHLFDDILFPMILAIITGFFGGAFAILGKMFIKWLFKSKNKKK